MYGTYAAVYDRIGQAAWSVRMAAWTLDWLAEHAITIARVADFGCGTGAAARVFAGHGLTVVGVDCAAAMLDLARVAPAAAVQWIQADLRTIELVEPVDLVTAFFDTLNYVTTEADLQQAWQRIGQALVPGGHAVVDLLTPAAYAAEWNDRDVIVADTDDIFVLNRLHFDALQRIATGRILWWERQADGWLHGTETHQQRAHTDTELRYAIQRAGLEAVEVCTPTGAAPDLAATRLVYLARKGRSTP